MKRLVFTSYIIFLLIEIVCAQDGFDSKVGSHSITIIVPDISLVDIESASTNKIIFDLSKQNIFPKDAGNKLYITSLSNNTLWLNFSSARGKNKMRQINVKAEGIPDGLILMLRTTSVAINSNGFGSKGNGAMTSDTRLSNLEQVVVSDIKTGYTGNGANNGYNLMYSILLSDNEREFSELTSTLNNQVITISYTMVEQ